jgi:hypothetical protein
VILNALPLFEIKFVLCHPDSSHSWNNTEEAFILLSYPGPILIFHIFLFISGDFLYLQKLPSSLISYLF